jgi:hypothetical protein
MNKIKLSKSVMVNNENPYVNSDFYSKDVAVEFLVKN